MSESLRQRAEKVLVPTYTRFPVVFERGEGVFLWDTEGRRYTDFLGGIAVCALGHAHPALAEALARQARRLVHVCNLYYTIPQIELAEWLTGHSFAERVFFCNSGAEANEAAIKLARRYFFEQGRTGRFTILAMRQSFHGRTMATLSATGQEKIRKGFAPVLEGFEILPFDDLAALEARMDDSVAAVMLEPIQGEGGIRVPSPGYLQGVRRLCDATGALLIVDEVQTGIGRTGRWFAHEHDGIRPDIMTLAKALGNGLPIGAMLAREEVARALGPGSHGTTFGGTPLATAGALAVLQTIERENLVARAAATGAYFLERLAGLSGSHASVVAARGRGLMLGLELRQPAAPVVTECLQRGFVINAVQENVLRFVPPLIIGREHIDALVACLEDVLP